MNDDEWEILSDLANASQGLASNKQWLRACELNGPVGSAQRTTIRRLLKAGYIERRERAHRANRNRTFEYRITGTGLDAAEAELKVQEARYSHRA